jgi:hypothetical protein
MFRTVVKTAADIAGAVGGLARAMAAGELTTDEASAACTSRDLQCGSFWYFAERGEAPERNEKLVSRPEELHPRPLAERSVRLSPHFAPIRRTCRSCRASVIEVKKGIVPPHRQRVNA